jgi:hypothetical protein
VLPAPLGGRRGPSTTQADLRAAFPNAGVGWGDGRKVATSAAAVLEILDG